MKHSAGTGLNSILVHSLNSLDPPTGCDLAKASVGCSVDVAKVLLEADVSGFTLSDRLLFPLSLKGLLDLVVALDLFLGTDMSGVEGLTSDVVFQMVDFRVNASTSNNNLRRSLPRNRHRIRALGREVAQVTGFEETKMVAYGVTSLLILEELLLQVSFLLIVGS